MRKFETNKLFYDEYLYKISVHNSLSTLFRGKNFSFARKHIDRMQQDFEVGKPIYKVHYLRQTFVLPEELQVAQMLLKTLSSTTEKYKLRIDGAWMSIYSNNQSFLDKLCNKMTGFMLEYHAPNPRLIDIIKENKNTVVLKNRIPYKYRITLGETTPESFGAWAKKNTDKVKIGSTSLEVINFGGYTKGLYFYARDEKIIQLLTLMIGASIRRIDKVVYAQDLDK